MPIYEYISEEDGHTISLLRPAAEADLPVPDPEGRGRHFVRRHSTFAVHGASSADSPTRPVPRSGGGCACGNPHGPCGSG